MRRFPPLGGTEGDDFIDGDPDAGVFGSIIPAEALNALRDEMANAIEALGLAPDQASNAQLATGLSALQASQRTRLTSGMTLYCSPTGSDSTGDGSAAAPFRQPQTAHDHAVSSLDLAGQQLTIKLAAGSYDSVSLGPLAGHRVDPTVTGAASSLPTLEGDVAAPDTVILDGAGTAHGCGVLARAGAAWRVRGCKVQGATYGACAHAGLLHLEANHYAGGAYALVSALAGGFVLLTGGGRLTAGSEAAFLAHGGSQIYGGIDLQTFYVDNAPTYSRGTLATCNGCRMILDAVRWSGAATGKRHYTEAGCTVYVGGVYAPGTEAGIAGTYSYVG